MRHDIPIIVLAAGQSSRMGEVDKLLEQVDGMPLILRQVRLARGSSDAEVIVALPPPPHARHDVLADEPVTRVEVAEAAEGINASLRTAIGAVPDRAEAVMVVLADLPDLTEGDIKFVLDAVDITSKTLIWRGATQDGKPGHPVVFRKALFPAIAALRGDGGAKELMALAGSEVALIALPDGRARADLDTPEDWAMWRRQNPGRA